MKLKSLMLSNVYHNDQSSAFGGSCKHLLGQGFGLSLRRCRHTHHNQVNHISFCTELYTTTAITTPSEHSVAIWSRRFPEADFKHSMPLTRKQAWRRVKVRLNEQFLEGGCDEINTARCGKRPARDMLRPNQRQQAPPQTTGFGGACSQPNGAAPDSGDPLIGSPPNKDKCALDRWRLPKEGREPTARPGVTAARRQAAAACVRVGSQVSFNTVVAAILIPSAKDLQAAARQELWWQETDYRDFRINFIQFMRSPTCLDDPEMVPVDIVAESGPPTSPTEETVKEDAGSAAELKPVFVGAVMMDEPPAAAPPVSDAKASEDEEERCVRAYEVEPEDVAEGADSSAPERSGFDTEQVSTAARTMSTAPPASLLGSDVEGASVRRDRTGVGSSGGIPSLGDYICGDDGETDETDAESTSAVAAAAAMASERWAATTPGAGIADKSGDAIDEDGRENRTEASLSWDSSTTDGEEDGDGNIIRVRRTFSNLETARRQGAGLDSEITSDDTDSGDDGDESSGAGSGRPRAWSLDGWFTCRLEQAKPVKSYDTHDHAGRLRDLVKLPPLPTVQAAFPDLQSNSADDSDAAATMQRLHVSFNGSVGEKGGDTTCRGSSGFTKNCRRVGVSFADKRLGEQPEGEGKFGESERAKTVRKASAGATRNVSKLTGKAENVEIPVERVASSSTRFDLCVS